MCVYCICIRYAEVSLYFVFVIYMKILKGTYQHLQFCTLYFELVFYMNCMYIVFELACVSVSMYFVFEIHAVSVSVYFVFEINFRL